MSSHAGSVVMRCGREVDNGSPCACLARHHSLIHSPINQPANIHTHHQVCQWYARDFNGQLFPLLLQCLSDPKAAALRRMLSTSVGTSGNGDGGFSGWGGGGGETEAEKRGRSWAGSLSLSGGGNARGDGVVAPASATAMAAAAAAQVAVKYLPFAFETRPLRRLDEEEEAMLMQM